MIADQTELAEALATDFEAYGQHALQLRGTFTVALSGGSLAARFFPRLARLPFDWSRTEFFWADERAVPPSDPESNYAVAVSLWLGPAKVPPANIHRMRGEDADLNHAARDYAAELVHIYIDLMNAGAPYSVIRDAVYIHPTLAEAIQSAATLLG